MSIRNRAIAAVGGVGLTLAIAVGAVAAGGPHGGTSTPTTGGASSSTAASTTTTAGFATTTNFSFGNFGDLGGLMGAGGLGAATIALAPDPAQCQDVQSKLAANLGVTTDQLQSAIKKTMLQEIDENEKAGKLTADQAKAARDRVNSTTDFCANLGTHFAGPGGQRPGGGKVDGRGGIGIGGIGMADSATYQAVATYFGINTDQLQQDLKDAGSLQGVAAKYGKDNTAGKAALEAAMEQSLKADLAKRNLPQTMIDQIVAQFKTNFDTLYTAKMGQGMPIGPGGQNRTPGQRPGGPRPSATPSPTSQTQ